MIFEVYYYHNNLTQTIFEMTQFKMSRGTFDPLSIISRLNTGYDQKNDLNASFSHTLFPSSLSQVCKRETYTKYEQLMKREIVVIMYAT